MPQDQAVTDSSDDRALRNLRRRARYLTGDTRVGNALAKATSQVMSGNLPRQHPKEPRSLQLYRALHMLHPELADSIDLMACAAQTLETIEHCSKLQVANILDIDHSDERLLAALRKRRIQPDKRRILIVEDEALLAMDICNAITECGNSIVGVSRTGAEAVEAAIRVKPDIIVSDLALADGSSGTEAVSVIESRHEHIPVVILTGTPDLVLTEDPDDPIYVLAKPHEPEQLQLMMALALRPGSELPSLRGTGSGEEPDQEPNNGE